MSKRVKVAVYAIALNEAKHAKRWAETTKHADIRVVADTGSTDATARILQKHGVTVYHIHVSPWRFDVARNTAMALIPSDIDVCITLDMDELLSENFIQGIKQSWVKDKTTVGLIPFDTGSVWNARRVHARNGFVWRYPIHEIFVSSMGSPDCQQLFANIQMRHDPDRTKSRSQYLPMLKAAAADNEYQTDVRMQAYLGREYGFYKDWDNVLKQANILQSIWKSPNHDADVAITFRFASQAHEIKKQWKDALLWANRAYTIDKSPESEYRIVLVYYAMLQDPEYRDNKALTKTLLQHSAAAIKALEDPERANAAHHNKEAAVQSYLIYDIHAYALFQMGDLEQAALFNDKGIIRAAKDNATGTLTKPHDFIRMVGNDHFYRPQRTMFDV